MNYRIIFLAMVLICFSRPVFSQDIAQLNLDFEQGCRDGITPTNWHVDDGFKFVCNSTEHHGGQWSAKFSSDSDTGDIPQLPWVYQCLNVSKYKGKYLQIQGYMKTAVVYVPHNSPGLAIDIVVGNGIVEPSVTNIPFSEKWSSFKANSVYIDDAKTACFGFFWDWNIVGDAWIDDLNIKVVD